MTLPHKVMVNGYHTSVWFSKNAITNIIVLSNLRLQYLVTNRSNEMMFIVHIESKGKPNMQFIMHEIFMHSFDTRDQEFAFVDTVSENK